jgi:hypothetical protein
LDGDFVLDCRDDECRTASFADKKKWWETLGTWWSRDAASEVKAQNPSVFFGIRREFPPDAIVISGSSPQLSADGLNRDGLKGIAIIENPTIFNFGFSIPSSNIYTAYLSVQNAGVHDILSAPRCNGQNESQCIPDSARSFIFSNITLKKNGQIYRELGSNTVSAANSPQAIEIPLGLLQSGNYTLSIQWNNAFEKNLPATGGENINITYRLSLQVNGLVISPPSKQASAESSASDEDVIGVRAYSNPEYLTLLEWYQKNVPNPGNPTVTTINGFPALKDQGTIYIMGFNIIEREKLETWGLTPPSIVAPDPPGPPVTPPIGGGPPGANSAED